MMTPEQCARALWDCGAIKIDVSHGYRMAIHEREPNAPLSPIYVNLRTPDNGGTLTKELVDDIGELLWSEVRDSGFTFDAIAGIARAGDPLAEAFNEAAAREEAMFPRLKLQKNITDGKRTFIVIDDDQLDPINIEENRQNVVLLLDDVFTHGVTKRAAVQAVLDAGFSVTEIAVVLDRTQADNTDLGGLTKLGITAVLSCLDLLNLMDMLTAMKLMLPYEYDIILKYFQRTNMA